MCSFLSNSIQVASHLYVCYLLYMLYLQNLLFITIHHLYDYWSLCLPSVVIWSTYLGYDILPIREPCPVFTTLIYVTVFGDLFVTQTERKVYIKIRENWGEKIMPPIDLGICSAVIIHDKSYVQHWGVQYHSKVPMNSGRLWHWMLFTIVSVGVVAVCPVG
jgi:hypothetical protein